MTGNPALGRALAYARRGWPVFPCHPGEKTPATTHGYRDATTDPEQITTWYTRRPDANLAIATGHPGPDVLDVDDHGPDRNGYGALAQLRDAGLLGNAAAYLRTPGGGLHAYYTGTTQRCAHLAAHRLDFLSAGGYVLAPPSQIDGRPYRLIKTTGRTGTLDWAAAATLLHPDRQPQHPQPGPAPGRDLSPLARWVAAQPEGNRNSGLYWAANRALEADPAADLSPLAAAARAAGLADLEITRTLNSARNRHHQAEAT
ncbi:MAG TPA: bifunctional DNA primase/polymerase [Streptosporangiaceae bacterium]|nr:bifunctional DNA primase/polymerase [Streptosporangiaceae bacterium]